MASLFNALRCICGYLALTCLAVLLAAGIGDVFNPGLRIEEKSHGPVEQRFYLLLLDTADDIIAHGHKRHFRYGMTREEQDEFAALLHGIRFSRDCVVGQSHAVDGGVSCRANGRYIDFMMHSVL